SENPVFNNAGTFRKSAGAGITAFSGNSAPGPAFNNSGLLDVRVGKVRLAGGTNSGQLNVAAGAELRFFDGPFILGPGTLITGSGSVALGGAAPVLKLNTNIVIQNFAFDAPGILDGAGGLVVTGEFHWSGGTIQGGGILSLSSNATLAIGG